MQQARFHPYSRGQGPHLIMPASQGRNPRRGDALLFGIDCANRHSELHTAAPLLALPHHAALCSVSWPSIQRTTGYSLLLCLCVCVLSRSSVTDLRSSIPCSRKAPSMDGDDHDAGEDEDRYIELDHDGAPHKVTAPLLFSHSYHSSALVQFLQIAIHGTVH